jgi:hypothetical protein
MSAGRPIVIFHLGQHKTGSKALQAYLAHNRRALTACGVCYPMEKAPQHGVPAYARSQYCLFALIRREALARTAGSEAAAAYWKEQAPFCWKCSSVRAFFEHLEAERRRSGWTRAVLSAEDLFDMQTAHALDFTPELVETAARLLADMADAFDYQAQVVIYVRRQDHLLGAHYVQYIKGSPIHDVDLDSFARDFAPRLDTCRILRCWEVGFRGRILVRPYERVALPGGIVPDFFRHGLALPIPAECTAPPSDAESENRSLGRDLVEFIRILNARYAAGQPVFDREDVLTAAFGAGTRLGGPAGIAAWWSAARRRELLAAHEAGNASIARELCGRANGRLFAEPEPADEDPRSYTGLSADRATAMALTIHHAALTRLGITTRKPAAWRLLRAVRHLGARALANVRREGAA